MILGWMSFGAPRPTRKPRTLSYTRVRRRRIRVRNGAAPDASSGDTEVMLNDRGTELPTATIRAIPASQASFTARIVGELTSWLAAQWEFVRPRILPSLVALAGMFAMIASMRALSPSAVRPAPAVIPVHVAFDSGTVACADHGQPPCDLIVVELVTTTDQ